MTPQPASLLRRFGAIIYDSLLVIATLCVATVPFIAIRGGEPVEPSNLSFQLSLLVIVYCFFVGFWTFKGRTLGMQSWGLQCESAGGKRPSLSEASLRFAAAIFSWLIVGFGFLWQLVDKDSLALHDRISGTRLMFYKKQ